MYYKTLYYLKRNLSAIISVVLLFIILIILNLIKEGYLTIELISKNKDFLTALNSIVNSIIFTIVSVFSYYKFFKGQLFAYQLIADINVVIFPFQGNNRHNISVKVKNLGTVRIWNPIVKVISHEYLSQDNQFPVISEFENWGKWNDFSVKGKNLIVDSNEEILFYDELDFDTTVEFVKYIIHISTSKGGLWKFVKIVKNQSTF